MQITKKHLILSLSALILASCGGSLAQKQDLTQQTAKDNPSATTQIDKKDSSSSGQTGRTVKQGPTDNNQPQAAKKELSAEVLNYLMVAEIAGQRGKLGVAVANYVQAAKISQDAKIAERASRIAIFARKDRAALEAGSIWVKLAPKNADAHQLVAAMLVRTGDIEGALSHFERVLALSKRDEQKTFMLITSLLSKERDKHIALDIMKRLLDKHSESANAWYSYANLALLTKEYEIANNAIDHVLKLKKHWNEAAILKATILSRLDKEKEALVWLKKRIDKQPSNHKLRMYYARKLVDARKYPQAYAQFEKVYDNSQNMDALYAMGLLANRMGKTELAENHFSTLANEGGRRNEANFYLGQINEKKKQYSDAIRWYSKVHSGVYAFDAKLRIIVLLGKQGKVQQAREQVKFIKVRKPNEQVRLYIAEGEVLRENKMYNDALELYTDGLSAIPDNMDLLYARALVLEKLNRIDDAVSDLRMVVKLDPQNAQALNALGYTLVDKTDKVNEGLQYISQAFELRPSDPAIIDSMGWAYYRLGKLDKAVTFLKRAFSQLNDAEVAAHLGEVLWVRGDKEEAKRIWKNSLRDTPEHDTLINVMKRFLP